MIRHSKCESNVGADVSGIFVVRTPSLSITLDGIGVGVLEISADSHKNFAPKYYCPKCNVTISDVSELEVSCSICGRWYSTDKMEIARNFEPFCHNCGEVLQGKKPAAMERQKKLLQYIRMPEETQIVKLSAVFSKPISCI